MNFLPKSYFIFFFFFFYVKLLNFMQLKLARARRIFSCKIKQICFFFCITPGGVIWRMNSFLGVFTHIRYLIKFLWVSEQCEDSSNCFFFSFIPGGNNLIFILKIYFFTENHKFSLNFSTWINFCASHFTDFCSAILSDGLWFRHFCRSTATVQYAISFVSAHYLTDIVWLMQYNCVVRLDNREQHENSEAHRMATNCYITLYMRR